tara:strand:+ start:1869 stop:2162 length:294 start_codon:yes stop_codon:yes gene_type:complete
VTDKIALAFSIDELVSIIIAESTIEEIRLIKDRLDQHLDVFDVERNADILAKVETEILRRHESKVAFGIPVLPLIKDGLDQHLIHESNIVWEAEDET